MKLNGFAEFFICCFVKEVECSGQHNLSFVLQGITELLLLLYLYFTSIDFYLVCYVYTYIHEN